MEKRADSSISPSSPRGEDLKAEQVDSEDAVEKRAGSLVIPSSLEGGDSKAEQIDGSGHAP